MGGSAVALHAGRDAESRLDPTLLTIFPEPSPRADQRIGDFGIENLQPGLQRVLGDVDAGDVNFPAPHGRVVELVINGGQRDPGALKFSGHPQVVFERNDLDRDAAFAGVDPNRIEIVGRRLERRQNHLDGTRPVPRHLGDAVEKFARDGDLPVGVRHGSD